MGFSDYSDSVDVGITHIKHSNYKSTASQYITGRSKACDDETRDIMARSLARIVRRSDCFIPNQKNSCLSLRVLRAGRRVPRRTRHRRRRADHRTSPGRVSRKPLSEQWSLGSHCGGVTNPESKLLIISLCVCYALADVSHVVGHDKDRNAQILRQGLELSPDGSYTWSYESDNGISAGATGEVINPESDKSSQVAQGQAAWTSPEGEQVSLQYIADANGYQPQGSHIPTPPPIPAAIIRALEYIRDHPPKKE